MRNPTQDPLRSVSTAERWRWRAAARRTQREHEAEQLAILRGMASAGGEVTRMITAGSPNDPARPVEIVIAGRRLRGRVYRPAVTALREAVSSSVRLLGVSRYGPYWVLTFKLAAEPLVVLADRLTLLPDWGGPALRPGGPFGPYLQFSPV